MYDVFLPLWYTESSPPVGERQKSQDDTGKWEGTAGRNQEHQQRKERNPVPETKGNCLAELWRK